MVAALCANGVMVVGVNAQHCFSFVRGNAEIRAVAVPDAGSQFRSRDLFPAAVAQLARGDTACLGPVVDETLVLPAPEHAIAYVDGYGNLKTTWHEPPATLGSQVQVTVGGASAVATVSDGTFAVRHGEMSFAPGSSGWQVGDGRLVFYEVLLRGGSAAERLDSPHAGAPVEVVPL